MSLVLDAGALVAVDRRVRTIGAMLRVAHEHRIPLRSSAAVIAQVWRNGSKQANLARILGGVDVVDLHARAGRDIGLLLATSKTAEVVDGHVALLTRNQDRVLTSDSDDIAHLLVARGVTATVVTV